MVHFFKGRNPLIVFISFIFGRCWYTILYCRSQTNFVKCFLIFQTKEDRYIQAITS